MHLIDAIEAERIGLARGATGRGARSGRLGGTGRSRSGARAFEGPELLTPANPGQRRS